MLSQNIWQISGITFIGSLQEQTKTLHGQEIGALLLLLRKIKIWCTEGNFTYFFNGSSSQFLELLCVFDLVTNKHKMANSYDLKRMAKLNCGNVVQYCNDLFQKLQRHRYAIN